MFTRVFLAWKKDYGEKIALSVCAILREHGVEYVFDEPNDCDLAIMAGGDGTLLKYQSALECPMFGINPGKSVGHYTTTGAKDFEGRLRKVLAGEEGRDYLLKKYDRLETAINKVPLPFMALNEVLVSPIYVRRILDSMLKVKAKETRERNSGILIYTPSGSNAYAKSAGAKPIKGEKRYGVAAIAPYAGRLKRGEIILSKGFVSVKCLNDEGDVCVDGQEDQVCKIKANDVVSVTLSKRPARIVRFG